MHNPNPPTAWECIYLVGGLFRFGRDFEKQKLASLGCAVLNILGFA